MGKTNSTQFGVEDRFPDVFDMQYTELKDRLGDDKLKQKVFVSSNGCVFVGREVREGILPKLLTELLQTRVMIKDSMKIQNKESFEYKV